MEGLIMLAVLVVLAVPVLLIAALVMIGGLKRRVSQLESDVTQLRAERAVTAEIREPTLGDLMRERAAAPAAPAAPRSEAPASVPPAAATPAPERAATALPPERAVPPPLPSTPAPPPRPARPSRPDPLTLAARAVRRWFTEGNVPVKVGVLVLFAGVAALLKYASDQGWMTFPIELRLAGIAAAGVAALVFGWRQREQRRGFALSLQGGAVGVLLLVVFAAFKLYHLIPAGAALGLSVVIVAGAGVLAVVQNALALALLAVLAGFLAPIWLSTGGGNHVALFGYYAVLNAAILAIAWWRPWRALNVLGFAFTFGIGALWGLWNYQADKFGTTQPFLLLFFAFYLLIPILYARRRAAGRRDLVDGCLVFGTPLVAFSLQAGLLQGMGLEAARMPLAYCALGLGALYAVLAALLRRREHYASLATSYALLAVGFATLAVPLALSAQATASVFALEGAALIWLGLRQDRRLPQLSGLLLQLLAAGSFAIGVDGTLPATDAVLNARCMGALLIALAGFFSAWSYRRNDAASPLGLPYYLWGLAWWLGNGVTEIERFVVNDTRPDVLLVFAIASGWIAGEFHRRLPARALAWTTALALASALPLALAQDAAHGQPFAGLGIAAWLAYALAGWRSLGCLRDGVERDEAGAGTTTSAVGHFAWLWGWPLAIGLLLEHLAATAALGEGWRMAAFALPWLALAAVLQWRAALAALPFGERFHRWSAWVHGALIAVLALAAVLALFAGGDSQPLPWIPLLNPLDLAQLGVLGLALKWLGSGAAPDDLRERRIPVIAAAAFALVTAITLRATHHWGGVPWDGGMFSTSLVQTSLTIVWSVLGVLGWILGSRRGQRGLWLAGAVLMAVVLAKLVFVDRSHLGNLLGIASFMAYGLLCTAVGYFAPAPPRTASTDHPVEEAA
ncbi:DUF2339 domain-containing protein [Lysobacter solisilvae (ex Woo and Kim 2020)]|uniref:DUF2339 domain-containing protein n=1 Tax=Agrilutibacter terrestris TaxID=2865112 RepID=A0A7H0FUS3_9GAMM|nr:DUF2339 domain-containing protein [Lysobacter terrestris]QNP39789.1 DUF2339 domain-containing protein [Lysobacter terrestris]